VVAARPNQTGMFSRDDRDHADRIGSIVAVELAHPCGNIRVWRTVDTRA
jgi:hypothetical protein